MLACRISACLVSFCGVILELLLCNENQGQKHRLLHRLLAPFCLLARESSPHRCQAVGHPLWQNRVADGILGKVESGAEGRKGGAVIEAKSKRS